MKSFFNLFKMSAEEIIGEKNGTGKSSPKVLNIVVTGMLIAVYMAIEAIYIPVPFGKLNFAFIALAAIGMLMGPTAAFFAGGMCDILGYLIRPDFGAFLPLYTLIGMFQGLIYGLILYRKWGNLSFTSNVLMTSVRIIMARLCDVIIVNLLMNTAANMHYGFIPQQAFSEAVTVRFAKNALELAADIPLLLVILPVVLTAYTRSAGRHSIVAAAGRTK